MAAAPTAAGAAARAGAPGRGHRCDRRRRRVQRAGRRRLPGPVRARTVVLEARYKTGGAATTEAPWPEAPESKVTKLSYVMSLMPPTILGPGAGPLRLQGLPDGPLLPGVPGGRLDQAVRRRLRRNHEEVSRWSKKDADAMPRWDAWLGGLADVLGPLLLNVPPSLGSRKPPDLRETLRLAWRLRGLDVRTVGDMTRLMTMRIADLLDDWFESPQVKGALAVDGVIGTWAGPYQPGTAYVWRTTDRRRRRRTPGELGIPGRRHGRGLRRDRVRRPRARRDVRLNTGGRRVLVENGRPQPWCSNRRGVHARVVVSALHPRTAFLDQVGARPPDDFVGDIEHWKTRSGVVKINLALGRAPRLHRRPRLQPAGAPHRVGGDGARDGLHRAGLPGRPGGKGGRPPVQRRGHPTAFDKTLSPEGTHIMSLFTQ